MCLVLLLTIIRALNKSVIKPFKITAKKLSKTKFNPARGMSKRTTTTTTTEKLREKKGTRFIEKQ